MSNFGTKVNDLMQKGDICFCPSTAEFHHENNEIFFSILIPTWNNLPHLELCLKSISKHSRYKHQVIIHINEGSDGSLDWVKAQKLDYTHSEENCGVCFAFNAAAGLAKSDYILMLDDDNYLLPDWDYYLIEEIKSLDHPYFAISATKIERTKTFNVCAISPYNFGTNTLDFEEEKLLGAYEKLEMNDWTGSSWYPMVIHKSIWNLVGGMSVEYTPGMYSDPDFMMKLWQAGVRYFKGVSKSRSYHFMSKSVKRIKKNNGRKQFLLKWGMSNSTFRKFYLKLGEPFSGYNSEPEVRGNLKMRQIRDRIKILFSL